MALLCFCYYYWHRSSSAANSNMKIVAFQPMDNYFINDHFPINYYFGAVVCCCCLLLLVKNQSPWHHNNIPIFIQLLENLLNGILMSDSIELSCYGTIFFFFYFKSDNTTTTTAAAAALIWWHNTNNNNNKNALYENMNLMICMQLLKNYKFKIVYWHLQSIVSIVKTLSLANLSQ